MFTLEVVYCQEFCQSWDIRHLILYHSHVSAKKKYNVDLFPYLKKINKLTKHKSSAFY